jgi:hypothetical protein
MYRKISGIEQALRAAQAERKRDLQRGCIKMLGKQARQMARSHAKPMSKLIDIAPIELSALDKGEGPFDSRLGAFPGGAERHRFGTTSETGPKARTLSGYRAAIEPHVASKRCPRRTHRATVDPGRFDRDEHHAVPHRIAASEGIVLGGEIQHGLAIANAVTHRERDAETTSENDRRLSSLDLAASIDKPVLL